MTLSQAFQNLALFVTPSVIYAPIARWRYGYALSEILSRLGLILGERRWYLTAIVIAVPFCIITSMISHWTKDFQGSMIAPFVGRSPTGEVLGTIFLYGFVSTGIPEEIFFRGLIGGALFRRFPLWKANILQSLVFLLPHLLILLVAPQLWALVITVPLLLGVTVGWLAYHAGSVWPAAIVHAVPNAVGAMSVLNWTG